MMKFVWTVVGLFVAYILLKAVTAGDATPLHSTWTFLSTLFHNILTFVDTHFPTTI